jgi:hypothetical protein
MVPGRIPHMDFSRQAIEVSSRLAHFPTVSDKGSRHDSTVERAHDFGVSGHILV